MTVIFEFISNLRSFLLPKVFHRKSETKYIPVEESDYPVDIEGYKAFEKYAASIFPSFVEPNYLTYFRIVICIFVLFFSVDLSYPFIMLFIILGGLSDFFDGAIARSKKKKTRLGLTLDPLADKFLIFSILYILLVRGDIKLMYILVMAGCESHVFIIPILSYLYQKFKCGKNKLSFEASKRIRPLILGRIKVLFYIFAILFIIFGKIISPSIFLNIGQKLLIFGISVSLIALFQYLLIWVKNPY